MRKVIIFLLLAIVCLFFKTTKTDAIFDPLSVPNNKFGIHILFPEELNKAAELVNSGNGDWGYVIIPIQSPDRDLGKWQEFMDDAKKFHLIPVVRLATENYYFDTKVWRKPQREDVLDFANFLNSLDWPVKNRYIVIFNEVNRSDEWDGNLNPEEYAEILSYATEIFKSLSPDFFIISAGLDNAAPNMSGKYMDEYDYMAAMNKAVPGIFGLIDGLGSHSYPNPGFRQMPQILTSQSIYSFNFEKNLVFRLSGKNLPVFITETGWSKKELAEKQIAEYFKYAFQSVWTDKDIVTVAPFLLQAGGSPFSQFSLTNDDLGKSEIFLALAEISKTKGKPAVNYDASLISDTTSKNLPVKTFPKKIQYKNLPLGKTEGVTDFFKWLLKLSI